MLFVKEPQEHLLLIFQPERQTHWKKIPGKTTRGWKKGKKCTHEIIWLDCWSWGKIKNIGVQYWCKKIKLYCLMCSSTHFFPLNLWGMYHNEGLKRWTIVFFPSSNEQRVQLCSTMAFHYNVKEQMHSFPYHQKWKMLLTLSLEQMYDAPRLSSQHTV